MIYEDKEGNLIGHDEVSKLSFVEYKQLGIHPSNVDDGDRYD